MKELEDFGVRVHTTITFQRIARIVACMFCGFVLACGQASEDPLAKSRQAASGTITISGTITDASGNGVLGVLVKLSGSAQAQVVTDQPGTFSFSVPPGSYSITLSGSCISFEPSVVNLNNLTTNTVQNFVGSGDNIITNCEPNPNSGATSGASTISGHVTSAGHAVPGVQVNLNGSAQGVRITDETGAYSFSVNAGSYSLNISGGGCASFTPSVVNLNNVASSKTQDFTGTSCPPAPLAFCSEFNTLFTGQSGGPACATVTTTACPDAVGTWASTIVEDFLVSQDCRFGQFATLLSLQDIFNYINSLTDFTLQFFGCPFIGTLTGPLTFALIPPALSGHSVTTADVQALSSLYIAAVNQAIADNGSPPLTSSQESTIAAQLAFVAGTVHATNSSTFTFSTCP